jgi:predicted RNase H-like HicB family nuclease
MRYLIVLEQTEGGFSVQVPDLAVVTFGETIQQAKRAAIKAIKINLEAYQEAGKEVPPSQPVSVHWENPDFADLLFTHVDVEVHHPPKVAFA